MAKRISYVVEQQDIDDYKAAGEIQKRILLKALKGANMDGLTTGQPMGTGGGWDYCKLAQKTTVDFPKIHDAEQVDPVEFANGIKLAQFLIDAEVESDNVTAWLGVLLSLKGRDLMEDATHIRQRANDKRGKVIEYVTPSDNLNKKFEERALKAEKTRKTNDIIKDLKDQLAKKA
jgi:hypothetical protein